MHQEIVDTTTSSRPVETATIGVEEFRQLGLLHEVNRLILHPLGLALYTSGDKLGVFDLRDDDEGVMFAPELLSAEKATAVADLIERRGAVRAEHLGYVVQPLPPEVKQLKVSVLEHTDFRIGAPDEVDAGEELAPQITDLGGQGPLAE